MTLLESQIITYPSPSYLEVYLRQKPIGEEYTAMAATSPKPVVPVLCAALSPDGRWLAIGTSEKLIVWDMAQGKVSRRFRVGTAQAAFLDNETLATVTLGSHRMYLWNVRRGRQGESLGCADRKAGQGHTGRLRSPPSFVRYHLKLVAPRCELLHQRWNLHYRRRPGRNDHSPGNAVTMPVPLTYNPSTHRAVARPCPR